MSPAKRKTAFLYWRLRLVIDHLKSSFSEHEPEASDIIGAAGANHLSDHRPRS